MKYPKIESEIEALVFLFGLVYGKSKYANKDGKRD